MDINMCIWINLPLFSPKSHYNFGLSSFFATGEVNIYFPSGKKLWKQVCEKLSGLSVLTFRRTHANRRPELQIAVSVSVRRASDALPPAHDRHLLSFPYSQVNEKSIIICFPALLALLCARVISYAGESRWQAFYEPPQEPCCWVFEMNHLVGGRGLLQREEKKKPTEIYIKKNV